MRRAYVRRRSLSQRAYLAHTHAAVVVRKRDDAPTSSTQRAHRHRGAAARRVALVCRATCSHCACCYVQPVDTYELVRVDRVRRAGPMRAGQRQVACYARLASRAPRPTGWVWDKRICIYKYIYTPCKTQNDGPKRQKSQNEYDCNLLTQKDRKTTVHKHRHGSHAA